MEREKSDGATRAGDTDRSPGEVLRRVGAANTVRPERPAPRDPDAMGIAAQVREQVLAFFERRFRRAKR